MATKTSIIVKFDLEGYHCWPMAPDEYSMLRDRHGHIFHFEAYIPIVVHRQLEFLDVRTTLITSLQKSYGGAVCDFRGMSCEELANSLARAIHNLYDVAPKRVAVYEDQFVGAEVCYE